MPDEKKYEIVESGPVLAFDLSMVDGSWTEGEGGRMEPGSYVWIINMLGKGDDWYAAIFDYVRGPGDEVKQELINAKRQSMMFFHFKDKLANWYHGFLEQACPWALWPGFAPPADPRTGRPHFWHDWYTGGPDGVGACVRCSLVEKEYESKKDGKKKTQIKLVRNVELLEPSSFAKGMLAVAGIQDWKSKTQPAGMQQMGQLFANPAQVRIAVQQGLAATGQLPMMNLGGIVAPNLGVAPQRAKPVA
jgi:hypothetical protein